LCCVAANIFQANAHEFRKHNSATRPANTDDFSRFLNPALKTRTRFDSAQLRVLCRPCRSGTPVGYDRAIIATEVYTVLFSCGIRDLDYCVRHVQPLLASFRKDFAVYTKTDDVVDLVPRGRSCNLKSLSLITAATVKVMYDSPLLPVSCLANIQTPGWHIIRTESILMSRRIVANICEGSTAT